MVVWGRGTGNSFDLGRSKERYRCPFTHTNAARRGVRKLRNGCPDSIGTPVRRPPESPRSPRSLAMDELGLVEAVERLGERIIVTVALGADRRDDLGFAETLGVANR